MPSGKKEKDIRLLPTNVKKEEEQTDIRKNKCLESL